MKMSDVLHSIADLLGQQEGGEQPNHPENMEKSADDFQHDVNDGAEDGGANGVQVGDKMIPPLQQKLELLKKVAGEPNALDGNDELADIKKLSGMSPNAAVLQISSEDNDITG